MRWARSGATELAIRQKDNLLRALEDNRCHPTSQCARLAVSSALSKKTTSPEICVQERRIYLAVSDTVLKERRTARELLGWHPPARPRKVSSALRTYAATAARRPVLSEYCLTRHCPKTIAAGDIVRMGELPFALENAITAETSRVKTIRQNVSIRHGLTQNVTFTPVHPLDAGATGPPCTFYETAIREARLVNLGSVVVAPAYVRVLVNGGYVCRQ
jgi:hypothetical protein